MTNICSSIYKGPGIFLRLCGWNTYQIAISVIITKHINKSSVSCQSWCQYNLKVVAICHPEQKHSIESILKSWSCCNTVLDLQPPQFFEIRFWILVFLAPVQLIAAVSVYLIPWQLYKLKRNKWMLETSILNWLCVLPDTM